MGNSSGAVASETTCNINGYSAQTIITNSTFYNNSATSGGGSAGGGLYIYQATNGSSTNTSATLTNDTFFQNTSKSHGGGLYLDFSDPSQQTPGCSATLTSLTVYDNSAVTDGGGLYVNDPIGESVVTIRNTILDGNKVTAAGYNGPLDVTLNVMGVAMTDDGFNLIGTSDAMLFVPNNNNQINNNPGLANALAGNGAPAGYPQTLALSNLSPGYRNGDPTLANASGVLGLDERGFKRQANKVSIGAEDPDAID